MNEAHRVRWTAGALGLAALLWGVACTERAPRDTQMRPAGDEATPPPPMDGGSHVALVRVVHAIPSEASVDVLAGEKVTFQEVAYRAVTEYHDVPAQPTTFRLRPAGPDTSESLAEATESLAAGKHYTLLAMPSTGKRAAALAVINDELAPPDEGKAKLRVVNASPDPSEITVRLGGTERSLVSAHSGDPASGYSDIPPINGPLDVRRAGHVLVRMSQARFDAGRLYTVVLMQSSTVQPGLLEAWVIDESVALHPMT